MKLSTIAVLLALSRLSLTFAQSVEPELKKLEVQFTDAIVKKDFGVIAQMLADEFTNTGPDGGFYTKAQIITLWKSGEDVLSSIALSDFQTHVYGDTAVITYVTRQKESFKGRDVSGTSRWTDIWVRRGGSWQLAASHGSMVANP